MSNEAAFPGPGRRERADGDVFRLHGVWNNAQCPGSGEHYDEKRFPFSVNP